MKIASIIAATALLSTTFSYAGGEGWMSDFEAAKKKAAAEKKDLIIDFTGSDWCGWCIKLNEEVFQHAPFKTGVADNYILVELDYPRDKSKLSEETIAQNELLKETYQVQGYPTILIADAEGRPYAKTGYQKGGPEAYVAHLAKLQESKATRDEQFAAAEGKEGAEKAKALYAGLQAVPEAYHGLYASTIETIVANDPTDETGLKADQAQKEAMMGLEKNLQAAMKSGDSAKALTLVDEFVAENKPEGEKKQETLMIKLNILFQQKDFAGLEKVVDEVIAVDPESRTGKQMTSFKETRLPQLKEAAMKKAEPAAEEKK